MPTCLIALGSNLGERAATLDAAVDALAATTEIEVTARSAWQLTWPVGVAADAPAFLNGAVRLETTRSPAALLAELQRLETAAGRERHERWGNRTLDLDLLLYGEQVLETPTLVTPHPRMSFRRFMLEPAVEIAGELIHPTIGWPLWQLLERLEEGADCLALVATDNAVREWLAERVSERVGAAACGGPATDDTRWPRQSIIWLAIKGTNFMAAEPKLTVLVDQPARREAGLGPTLRLDDLDRATLEREVFAAIEAVWPTPAAKS